LNAEWRGGIDQVVQKGRGKVFYAKKKKCFRCNKMEVAKRKSVSRLKQREGEKETTSYLLKGGGEKAPLVLRGEKKKGRGLPLSKKKTRRARNSKWRKSIFHCPTQQEKGKKVGIQRGLKQG